MAAYVVSLSTLETDHIGRFMTIRSILSVSSALRRETKRIYIRTFCLQWNSSVLLEVCMVCKESGLVFNF